MKCTLPWKPMLFKDWLSMCVHACVHLHICSLRVVHRHQRMVLLVCRAFTHATGHAPVLLAEWSWCGKASLPVLSGSDGTRSWRLQSPHSTSSRLAGPQAWDSCGSGVPAVFTAQQQQVSVTGGLGSRPGSRRLGDGTPIHSHSVHTHQGIAGGVLPVGPPWLRPMPL